MLTKICSGNVRLAIELINDKENNIYSLIEFIKIHIFIEDVKNIKQMRKLKSSLPDELKFKLFIKHALY